MASAGPSTNRSGRPRKASIAASHAPSVTPGNDTPGASASAGGAAPSMPAMSFTSSGPVTVADCEHLAAQLLDTSLAPRKRLDVANELRDSAESNRDYAFYDKYLGIFIPVVVQILGDEKTVSFSKENTDFRIRHSLLVFVQRLTHSEPYKQHATTIMDLTIKLLKMENEENALLCIKIMIDAVRNYKDKAEAYVEPFLDLVKQMYTNIKTVVEKELSAKDAGVKVPSTPTVTASTDSQSSAVNPQGHAPSRPLARALHSPKVLTECPIAVVLIFQTYKTVMQPALLDFYPLVMESIGIQPEPQKQAYAEAAARGETFVGVAAGITNREVYTELIKAQVKTMAFLAYVSRSNQNSNIKEYLESFPEACIRLLRDCPPEDVSTRRELLVATRHILTADSRSSFVPHIDTLLDERVLVGTGISSREALRPLAHSVVADLIHHVRNDLSFAQLSRIVYVFSNSLNDSTFAGSIQTMCAKLLNTIIESVVAKGDAAEVSGILKSIFFTSLEKLMAVTDTLHRLKAVSAKGKGKAKEAVDEDVEMEETADEDIAAEKKRNGWRDIEQAMPVNKIAYADDSLETYCKEAKFLFKTLLHCFRSLLTFARQSEKAAFRPDGEMLQRLFQHSLQCLAIFEGNRDPREAKEAVELVVQNMQLYEPHSFSEVWLHNMDFFIDQSVEHAQVFTVLQFLVQNEAVSHQLVGILLRHLMSKLDSLGDLSKVRASLTLRTFKMSFLAINTFVQNNESVLVPHLQKLILDSFTYAAKAKDPTLYYQILRALFRSIGGGRFEALYKEVLPILQEMLDTLGYLLEHTTDPAQRDVFVELSLTVPVRLTNLLPHLSYLMKPLVHALQAGPDLISQGLRTLELCIDNLTAEFLDPTMEPVLGELMLALQKLLKPIPNSRDHAHSALKILGKLGGRNRRFLEVDHDLAYQEEGSTLLAPMSLEGKSHRLTLSPLIRAASDVLNGDDGLGKEEALQTLLHCALLALQDNVTNLETNTDFHQAIRGLLIASGQEDVGAKIQGFIKGYARRIFALEIGHVKSNKPDQKYKPDGSVRRFLHLTAAFCECFFDTFASSRVGDRPAIIDLFRAMLRDLRELAAKEPFAGKAEASRNAARLTQSFAHRAVQLCHEEDWARKIAGVTVIRILVEDVELPRKSVVDMELDLLRALLFCLRDAPRYPPAATDDVVDLMKYLIRTFHLSDDANKPAKDGKTRLHRLTETLVAELHSSSELSRKAAQDLIALLAEVTSQPVPELVKEAAKSKLLDVTAGPLFSKPLRALQPPIQVGNIEAAAYLMSLRPQIVETTDEMVRLLHEVLALADLDDASLNKVPTHKQDIWLKTLRVSCLTLLRAAMATPDFMNKQNLLPVRSRIIQVYFKHVYSASPEIVDVAYDSIHDVLEQQSKLPKEVLQSGLRPILINLADAKRLSVTGLEGLARFLELLTNYFKVEIGNKLLDHFQSLSDAQTMMRAAYQPPEDNADIMRMSRLIKIFRLLPDTANQFLKRLTDLVVEAETQLHQSAVGPFTENFAKFLNKYHVEASQLLIDSLKMERYVTSFRNVIASGNAPQLVESVSNREDDLCSACFSNYDDYPTVILGLQLVRELSLTSATWLKEHETVFKSIMNIWRWLLARSRDPKADMSDVAFQQVPMLILEMFMRCFEDEPHIELLYHLVETYEIRSSFDKFHVANFLYKFAAFNDSVDFRREVIEHFFTLYSKPEVTETFKTNALRLVVNPTLRTYYSDPGNSGTLVTADFIKKVEQAMWIPLSSWAEIKEHDDTLVIEAAVLSTLLCQFCGQELLGSYRKWLFKAAWVGLNLLEPTVKLTAYLWVARFMVTFPSPIKFVRLTWTGLLRLRDVENRALYRQTIDIVADNIATWDPPEKNNPAFIPEWASRVRTVLIEDGPATSQLVTICELLVNHSDLFYPFRELYVPHVSNSLGKLAFQQGATPEIKKLSVDVVELIFRWEKKRVAAKEEAMELDHAGSAEASPAKRQRLDRAGTVASSSSSGGWATPGQVKEQMTTHLLRLVSASPEPISRSSLNRRALDLFKEIIGPNGVSPVTVKLNFFNRTMLQDITENTINVIANSAETIAATAAVRDQNWIHGNLGILTKLLERVWVSDDTSLHETVNDLTESMFREMPDSEEADASPDAKQLFTFVQTTIKEGLEASLRSSTHIPGTLFVLRSWLKAKPQQQLQTEPFGSALLRVLAHLVKSHQAATGPDQSSRLIISVLDILRDRVADLREHRRHLISVLSTLVDRSMNLNLCRYLLDLVRHWTLDQPDPALGKERAGLLLKMTAFEGRDESLFQKYLDVVYDVYELDVLRGTDITHRLEPAFLLGTNSKDPAQRGRFLDKLESSLPLPLDGRLQYLYTLSNWDTLAHTYWIPQILSMVLGVFEQSEMLAQKPLSRVIEDDKIAMMADEATAGDLILPARTLIHVNSQLADHLWTLIFPIAWASLSRNQQTSFTGYIIKLLSHEYHLKQVELRPNVIQTFLRGILPCSPPVSLPPLLVKYLAKTFNSWYVGLEILTNLSDVYRADEELREACATALKELYGDLAEDDLFYGLARSKCVFPETNAALAYEQSGQWPNAIELYEQAQIKARNGLLPFTEEEYTLWEDHWVMAAQKLQNWDYLIDLAKVDQDDDLLLECAWRLIDWSTNEREAIEMPLQRITNIATPRRKTFEAWHSLLRAFMAKEVPNDFLRALDEAEQISLRKWVSLPERVNAAHVPLLQMFQQCVELDEASKVLDSLNQTNTQNLEQRVNGDLKAIFQMWRDRLPNFWDDILIWSDLLAWRQHVFQSVTRVYVPLIPPGETATYGFRGYHETAWMINRFGEVARRHGLLDVCSTSLNKIYALPNIEISEAFLKLREQALCFFQKPDKFNDGLENISTTNLMYFAANQKAEFLTLKGMFIAKLGQNTEANAEFAHAIQMDMNLPKAWAEWGKFNDQLYKEQAIEPPGPPPDEPGKPKETEEQWRDRYQRDRAVLASSAVSCYLQAAGLYSNHKARGLLHRVLWLLGLDDNHATISRAFESYKGDHVIWYWITLVPQLLLSLSHREAKQARTILNRIAKMFPQALFFHLRVSREDFANVKKQHAVQARQAAEKKKAADAAAAATSGQQNGTEGADADGEKIDGAAKEDANGASQSGSMPPPSATSQPPQPRQPWELVEEVMNTLKTAFPLLALTMEKMVDQISLRGKPTPDEDIYRFFAALLADGMQQWTGRHGLPDNDGELNPTTRTNLQKFSHNLSGDLRTAIEEDFMNETPKLREYIKKLQSWRDRYERMLDSRTRLQPLDQGGCNLIEFHQNRFEDVEVPGQYVHHVDQSSEFVRIARFAPKVELGRGHGHCFRRLTMVGTDGSPYTFNVQLPAARHCRREERLTQLFRIMNSVLKRRKESRKRNLQFHLPVAIPLAPQLRLVQSDASYVSLQDIYDEYCNMKGMSREDSIMAFLDRSKELQDPAIPRSDARHSQLKAEIMEEIQTKMVPENVLTNFMIKTMNDSNSLWLMRKQFASQTATTMFLTFACCLSNRAPPRFHLSRRTGLMYMTEILPGFTPGHAIIASQETVPFRLTPNMQHFITRTGVEGILTAATTAIARCLTEPEFDLGSVLSLFIRDEVLIWHNTYMKDPKPNDPLPGQVYRNVDSFIRRVGQMSYLGDVKDKNGGPPQFVQAMVPLISQATAPTQLSQMNENFMAWF